MTEDMRRCRKRERDRERERRKAEQGKFEASFLHIDHVKAEMLEKSPPWLSDRGSGVERLVDAIDGVNDLSWYNRRLKVARETLRRAHPELLEVFDLIVKNGKNRKESIWEMVKSALRKPLSGTLRESVIGNT